LSKLSERRERQLLAELVLNQLLGGKLLRLLDAALAVIIFHLEDTLHASLLDK
jgi:hypothetical protein